MTNGDLYVQAVESIYASGIEAGRISEALTATSRLLGARGATFEVIDKPDSKLLQFHSAGLPDAGRSKYSEHFAAHNPRLAPILRQAAGEVCFDYKLMDEKAMTRDAFYSEFLSAMGLRYFISAVLEQTPDRMAVISVQRSRRKGHADRSDISLMRRLCPHFQRAYMMRKLLRADASAREALFENALDLISDGIALLRQDGAIVYVNEALRRLADRGRDFRIERNTIAFSHPELRSRFANALGAVARLEDEAAAYLATDFAVPRDGGLPPYTVSVRPLVRANHPAEYPDATTMLLVHDPLERNLAAGRMLQDLYGLTNAEAQLVQALSTGMTAVSYAQSRGISITTVYTHLRRTREKTGWKSVAELTRRFHELNVALRAN
jgi:DNA-binding CsgD family transcriptional regulator/PAS domain-containing protein